jgi:hypothetical protein
MADTYRDVTACVRGENDPLDPLDWTYPLVTCTSAASKCQDLEELGLLLAILFATDKAIGLAIALHAMTGGATVSLIEGNLAGRPLYAVSIYPERSLRFTARPTREQLFAFITANLRLLLLPGHAIGSWKDKNNFHILDVVICLRDRDWATELGARFQQQSIFDLAAECEIAIAGFP